MLRLTCLIGSLCLFPSLGWAFGFHVSTQSVLPEISVHRQLYRLGIANTLGSEFIAYVGEKIYFLEDHQTSSHFKLGISGGIIISMTTDNLSLFRLNTEDGYFGLESEWRLADWGLGLAFQHHSAHLGDGVFPISTTRVFNQNFLSLRGVYQPSDTFHIMWVTNIYFADMPLKRRLSTALLAALNLWNALHIETGIEVSTTADVFETFRLKLSYRKANHQPRLIPYVLLHAGRHYLGQRFDQRLTQVLIGLEFDV